MTDSPFRESEPVNPFQILADEMEATERERDRYREALEQIRDHNPQYAQSIARSALEGK